MADTYTLKFVGILYKIRDNVPLRCLKTFYFGMIHSKLAYGIEIYANTAKTYLHKLHVLNNKILRVLLKADARTPVTSLYKAMDTLPIEKLHIFKLLIIVHKFFHHNHLLPPAFRQYFTTSRSVHAHTTRNNLNLYLYAPLNNTGKRSIRFKAPNLWNNLPVWTTQVLCFWQITRLQETEASILMCDIIISENLWKMAL